MAEYAPDKRRGFYGSFLEFGTLAGFNLGALIMLGAINTLSESQMHDWGCRIPLFVAGPLGLIGMYLRSRMVETKGVTIRGTEIPGTGPIHVIAVDRV